jgi:phosphopantothenoylcysteine decarboxylase / phosphopantothenate---cysteine ligase
VSERKRIIVGVAGGIAAYKAATVVRQLTEAGHSVRVVPTESALRFVGAATFEALSGHPVHTGVWNDVHEVPHVRIGQEADLVVVAPATADLLARAVSGHADDLLTATLLTARCPVLFAPAMHTEMWFHPATVDNVATLRQRGAIVLEPASGRLTGADTGAGRLPEAEEITTLAQLLLDRGDALPYDLAGVKVLVTAGGTREPIDPVRFIGNRSSGKQGYAIAAEAATRGAGVVLVSTVDLPAPPGVDVVPVETAEQLEDAVTARAGADVIVMAAAVADFRPKLAAPGKLKKQEGPPEIVLEPTPDILAGLGAAKRAGQVLVGFAAETDDLLANAEAKLAAKRLDLVVANDVSAPGVGFGHDTNAVVLLRPGAEPVTVALRDKRAIAAAVLDTIVAIRSAAGGPDD